MFAFEVFVLVLRVFFLLLLVLYAYLAEQISDLIFQFGQAVQGLHGTNS